MRRVLNNRKVKGLLLLFGSLIWAFKLQAQTPADTAIAISSTVSIDTPVIVPPDTTIVQQPPAAGDDPSQFFTRVEVFNNLQHYNNLADFYLNVTTIRTIVQFRKHITTRLDIPFSYNSFTPAEDQPHYGLGDISFRLLGFRAFAKKANTLTVSVEFSFNTATSPLLGTGKNLIIPLITYTAMIKNKGLFSTVVQQANSMWGDKDRKKVNFTKMQFILLTLWAQKFWTVLAPELYIDYIDGADVSMNLQGRLAYAPVRQVNLWVQASTGLFGNFVGRYQWSTEVGIRYFPFMKKIMQQHASKK